MVQMQLNRKTANSSPGASMSERASTPLPSSDKEQEDVKTLTMISPNSSETIALRVLRKHHGDIQRAAAAILEGDIGEAPEPPRYTVPTRPTSPKSARKAGRGSPVVDLTGDDEDVELARALKASLETVHDTSQVRGVNFGPSTRAPDPNWAVVPSNVAASSTLGAPPNIGLSQEDRTLQRVMQESLNASYNELSVEESSLEDRVRRDGRPVALRASETSLIYASLLIHALFFVPQVRARIAAWRPTQPSGAQKITPPIAGPERAMWSLLEAHANMDMVYITELESDRTLEVFGPRGWDGTTGPTVRELSRQFLATIARLVESLVMSPEQRRLFSFRYGNLAPMAPSQPMSQIIETTPQPTETVSPPPDATGPSPDPTSNNPTITPTSVQDACIVEVDLDLPIGQENDLVSRLSAQLLRGGEGQGQQVIIDPSDVVAFQLQRSNGGRSGNGTGGQERKPFVFPKHMFLDQFLASNAELARSKRDLITSIEKELDSLNTRRGALRWHKGNDTLKNLRSSIYYFENVAQADDSGREDQIKSVTDKLKKCLAKLEHELIVITEQIDELQSQFKGLFDTQDFQQHRYDLRVVFMHDGLFGRRQLYTYVQDKGKWWKVIDNEVTEVSEDVVLTDTTGLHLGAGPYLLIYSRALAPEEQVKHDFENINWPEPLRNSVQHNNDVFLSALSPETRAQLIGNRKSASVLDEFRDEEMSVKTQDVDQQTQMDIVSQS